MIYLFTFRCKRKILLSLDFSRLYIRTVATKKNFVAFRVAAPLRDEIQKIAEAEARSVSQICELLLSEGVDLYRKEGPKFIQRLIAKQRLGPRN
jgi:hypothetical protein